MCNTNWVCKIGHLDIFRSNIMICQLEQLKQYPFFKVPYNQYKNIRRPRITTVSRTSISKTEAGKINRRP